MRLRVFACVFGMVLFGWCVSPGWAASVRALDGRGFVDSVGLNVHTSFLDTAYVRPNLVLAALQQLHVRHVRDGLDAPSLDAPSRAWQAFYFGVLGSNGIRGDLIAGRPDSGQTVVGGYASEAGALGGFVEAVEGPNEYDLSGASGWSATVRDYQSRLFAAVHGTSSLQGVPVLGPSFGNPQNMLAAGDLSRISDVANVHAYPGGQAPTGAGVDAYLSGAHVAWGSRPVVFSETGYHNAMLDSGGVSERAAAAYIPRLVMLAYQHGVTRTYLYELVDEKPDSYGFSRDKHFGLFRNDFSPKPAAMALGKLLSLADGPQGSAQPRSLDYTLSGATTSVQQLLLKRSDGSYALMLWQDASVWDPNTRRDLYPPSTTARLQLPTPATIQTTTLLSTATPTTLTTNGNQASLTIPANDTTVVLIHPTGTTPPPSTTPTTTTTTTTTTPSGSTSQRRSTPPGTRPGRSSTPPQALARALLVVRPVRHSPACSRVGRRSRHVSCRSAKRCRARSCARTRAAGHG